MWMWDTWRCISEAGKCREWQQAYGIYNLAVGIYWMNDTTARDTGILTLKLLKYVCMKLFNYNSLRAKVSLRMGSMFVIPAVLCFRAW